MMITTLTPHALRTMRLLCSAAAAGTFALACASAAQAADAPVSSPTSPPKVTTTAQKPAAPSRANRLQAICSSADLNHDGKVSLEEFHRDIVQGWHNLSPDATGHVQLSDLAQVPRMGKGRLKRLAAVDTDSDGKLSFSAPAGNEPADTYVYDPKTPVQTIGGGEYGQRTAQLHRETVAGPRGYCQSTSHAISPSV